MFNPLMWQARLLRILLFLHKVFPRFGTLQVERKLLGLVVDAGHRLFIELTDFLRQLDQRALCVASRYVVFMFLAPVEMAVE